MANTHTRRRFVLVIPVKTIGARKSKYALDRPIADKGRLLRPDAPAYGATLTAELYSLYTRFPPAFLYARTL